MKVVFAAAEIAPLARVGGLAEAAGGLCRALRNHPGVELTILLPDYGDVVFDQEDQPDHDAVPGDETDDRAHPISVPDWVGWASRRCGFDAELGAVELVSTPSLARPHPYVDENGQGWSDNDHRFFGFSMAIAARVGELEPDVVHLNDWHTAMALAVIETPTVFTIHTLGYQGHADRSWLDVIGGERIAAFDRDDHLNPVAGAISLADKVVAVSPTYAREILDPYRGAGLDTLLSSRGDDLVGIRNGIDVELWDPLTDPAAAVPYGRSTLAAKTASTTALRARASWPDDGGPIVTMVTRLVEQKGIDLVLGLVPYLERMGARLFLLGSGEERLARWARELAEAHPDRVHFVEGYDLTLARQLFAGGDLFVMPSRFEPCGLAQMQAMRYGTIPVVTPVGGLLDTVIDADDDPDRGNGFVALSVDGTGMVDALHRAVSAWRVTKRRRSIQRNGMAADWSWEVPMHDHVALYREVSETRA